MRPGKVKDCSGLDWLVERWPFRRVVSSLLIWYCFYCVSEALSDPEHKL